MAGRGVALGRRRGLEQPLYSVKQVHGVAGAPAQGGPQQPQQRSRGAAVQQNPRGARFAMTHAISRHAASAREVKERHHEAGRPAASTRRSRRASLSAAKACAEDDFESKSLLPQVPTQRSDRSGASACQAARRASDGGRAASAQRRRYARTRGQSLSRRKVTVATGKTRESRRRRPRRRPRRPARERRRFYCGHDNTTRAAWGRRARPQRAAAPPRRPLAPPRGAGVPPAARRLAQAPTVTLRRNGPEFGKCRPTASSAPAAARGGRRCEGQDGPEQLRDHLERRALIP